MNRFTKFWHRRMPSAHILRWLVLEMRQCRSLYEEFWYEGILYELFLRQFSSLGDADVEHLASDSLTSEDSMSRKVDLLFAEALLSVETFRTSTQRIGFTNVAIVPFGEDTPKWRHWRSYFPVNAGHWGLRRRLWTHPGRRMGCLHLLKHYDLWS